MIISSRYQVLEELGSGLWGTVYKVQDIRTQEIYALKLFHKLAARDLYEKFSAENMHHITKIHHLNLVHVLDFGNFGQHIYYLSEYFKGKTLKNFIFKSSNLKLLYDIVVQVCYGLNALHSQDIIHQDLKPANVVYQLKDNQPIVKIMDYGFTKIDIERSQQKVSSTLPYIAPEIYLDQEPVFQSDFYSLGTILYKLTTGILPYTIEQITGFIEGNTFNLIPKFPRELNPEIPDGLEKLILKLLERNPEDRFDSIEQIIKYINQIQIKQYPYSEKWSIVNNIKFSDYIVREDYSHQLLEYVPLAAQGNGKLIVITGGTGLGKTNLLALFRYHLLTDEYYIFDYECNASNHDPFFALIKEFYYAVENNEKLAEDLSDISLKLKEYLFESAETANLRTQNKEELSLDFQSASQFIFHLSEEKPLIYMIRAGSYLEKDALDFVNYISQDITEKPILIIISINDPRTIEGLIHPVRIKIETLNLEQITEYVKRLLMCQPPPEFLQQLWQRTNGNPLFIEQVLLDLTQKRKIWRSGHFQFDFNFDSYELPDKIKHSIYLRMAHLMESSYRHLQKLAYLTIPLSKELMKSVLNLNEKDVFFLIKDASNNEILHKSGEYYYFTFKESINRFVSEGTGDVSQKIAKKLLDYFDGKSITRIDFLQGIIKHADSIEDYNKVRIYRKQLINLYFERGNREIAFDETVKVLELDFSCKIDLEEHELRKDLQLVIEKSEWATANKIPDSLKLSVRKMPDIAEKHILMAVFYLTLEKIHIAKCRLEKALSLTITGKQRTFVLLQLSEIYFVQNEFEKMRDCISELEKYNLLDDHQILFISLKAKHIGLHGQLQEGINIIEEFITTLKTKNDDIFFVNLGGLYNTLAFLYHKHRNLDEAEKNFQTARKAWERVNYKKKLCIVYNNLGDVSLVQGYTSTALEYFEKALEICRQIDCKKIKVLSLLNHGEAYIKLGEFRKAEKYLIEALEGSDRIENHPFRDSIIYNISISRSKIKGFTYYIDFIKKEKPEILKGEIAEINPLTKTYFYYLYNLGDYKQIDQLLEKYKDLFFKNKQEEFYYQILGFITLKKNDIKNAFKWIDMAFKYSQDIKSIYAQAINYIRLAEGYLETGEYNKAIEILLQSRMISEQNRYNYWLRVIELRMVKAQLQDETTSVRILIRNLMDILKDVRKEELFYLEIECYEILIQIYNFVGNSQQAAAFFKKYKNIIKNVSENIPRKDRNQYYRQTSYHIENFNQLSTLTINVNKRRYYENWEEELYDILKLKENERIKFFIDKIIRNLLSPNYYAIILAEEIQAESDPFLIYNIEPAKLYTQRFKEYILKSLNTNQIINRKIRTFHTLFIPLRIKAARIGCLVIADKGELNFQDEELEIISNLRLHLSSILIRIKEFAELNNDMELMTKLIEINQHFFTIKNIERLEQDMVTFVLDFIGGSRGFLIKKDRYQNYIYKVALDESKQLLKNYAFISKTVLSQVQNDKKPVFIMDLKENQNLESFLSINRDNQSIYCAPIFLNDEIYGFIYIDNYNAKDNKMRVNQEFMRLLLIQLQIALYNAHQYQILMLKNQEIKSLEKLKNDFINIVSHELKTPLVTLQGYVNRLFKFKIPEKDMKTVEQIEKSVNRFYLVTNDIINHNKYILAKSIKGNDLDIKDILQVIYNEAKSISKDRHMQFKLEIEDKLPQIKAAWEAIHLSLTNIVLNAIRFTRDFGTIVIGARRSAFQQEEIEKQESLIIYVQDNGIGIPGKDLDKVFKKFFELNKLYAHSSGSIEFKSSGLGLGLSTAKLIVELHGGKIWINSKENEGTTVFIALPFPHESEITD